MTNELDEISNKYKYVIYARKSTVDETRQVRSIQDQISDCQKFIINRYGLKVVEVLEETQSAKIPNKRPIFNQMLQDLKKGKYDGVIAWNPDRLARNMLEAGRLIDMVDNGIIKDFKFVTHPFTRDANGMMLLGMAFVISKQYSDDLSQKVKRGVSNRLLDGLTPTPKHGYLNEEGVYKPEPKAFERLQKAWEMREKGESITSIAKWMTSVDYSKATKKGRTIKMDKRILGKVFKDPFYYGILIQSGVQIDLREKYDFVPMISQETYENVQILSYDYKPPIHTRRMKAFYPLKRLIKCSFCGENCVVGPSSGSKGNRYLYYRCDNTLCTREKKGFRGKVVFDFVYDFLADGLGLTEKDYAEYKEQMVQIINNKRTEMLQDLHSMEGMLKNVIREHRERSLQIISINKASKVYEINSSRIAELENSQEDLEEKISKLRADTKNVDSNILSIEEFLNLSENAGVIVKAGDAYVKDVICRIIFLNLSVGINEVLSYQLKEPFDTLLKSKDIHTGRGDRTRTCGLAVPNRAL